VLLRCLTHALLGLVASQPSPWLGRCVRAVVLAYLTTSPLCNVVCTSLCGLLPTHTMSECMVCFLAPGNGKSPPVHKNVYWAVSQIFWSTLMTGKLSTCLCSTARTLHHCFPSSVCIQILCTACLYCLQNTLQLRIFLLAKHLCGPAFCVHLYIAMM
jgi:hypothetical protein